MSCKAAATKACMNSNREVAALPNANESEGSFV